MDLKLLIWYSEIISPEIKEIQVDYVALQALHEYFGYVTTKLNTK